MEHATRIETQRLALQTSRDLEKTQAERNRLGQFATPTALAADVLRCAREYVSDTSVRFLDPAIGTGSFFSALLREFPGSSIEAATGFEIDPHYGEPSVSLWGGTSLELRLEDFTAAQAPAAEAERFNLVICNPPYVRHHHLSTQEKARLQMRSMFATGLRLSGLSGLYCHFVTVAHPWMRNGATAGWLIPSEFMDVNYGRELRRYLLNTVTLLRIHRFDPADMQFGDALVSSSVVWFQNVKPVRDHMVQFTFGGSLRAPRSSGNVSSTTLDDASKWTQFPAALTRKRGRNIGTLGDFFRVTRGIATGSNEFFLMTAEQARERGIPMAVLKPILPGIRNLATDEIDADENGMPLLERQLFVLDCRLPQAEIQNRYPRLWDYLETGKKGVANGYLCSKRSPWYSQENREPTYFLCTYIGRSKKDGRAHRFIFNRSRAIAANTYLMLYPREELAKFIGGNPERARRVWEELNNIHADDIKSGGRVYGGGMYKVEPKELASVAANGIAALLSAVR